MKRIFTILLLATATAGQANNVQITNVSTTVNGRHHGAQLLRAVGQ